MKNFWLTLPKPIIVLAPMAGYTDSAYRLICKKMGAQVVYSEMISVDAICFKNKKTLAMLKHSPQEYPLVFQLFGNDPKKFTLAIKIINNILPQRKKIGLDINFGCPAHKVTKNGAGSALMNEVDTTYQIIKNVCQHSNFPVSIKIRTKVKETTAIDFIKHIKDLPWTTVMIHGRTFNQGFTGPVDVVTIKKIKQLIPNKIVLANGGINNFKIAQQTLEITQADGLGLARSTWGNPWLFKEIKKNKQLDISWSIRKKIMLKHAKYFLKNNDSLEPLRKHLIHYIKGQKNAGQLRQRLIQVDTFKDLKQILNSK